MTLTVYSGDFDEPDSVSDGMSGKVFLDRDRNEDTVGTYFGKSLSDALMHVVNGNVQIDEIMFCYRDKKNGQMFKRFKINICDYDCGVV